MVSGKLDISLDGVVLEDNPVILTFFVAIIRTDSIYTGKGGEGEGFEVLFLHVLERAIRPKNTFL